MEYWLRMIVALGCSTAAAVCLVNYSLDGRRSQLAIAIACYWVNVTANIETIRLQTKAREKQEPR